MVDAKLDELSQFFGDVLMLKERGELLVDPNSISEDFG